MRSSSAPIDPIWMCVAADNASWDLERARAKRVRKRSVCAKAERVCESGACVRKRSVCAKAERAGKEEARNEEVGKGRRR